MRERQRHLHPPARVQILPAIVPFHGAATAAAPEAPAATGAAPKQESGTEEHAAEEEGFSAAAGELEQIPFVRLEIIQILEEGKFTAVVDAVDENPTSVEAGMELTVVVDASKIPGADREIQNDLREITENIIVVVEDGAYDAGLNVLYAAEVTLLCRDGQ